MQPQYLESDAAKELFQFQDRESAVSKRYEEACVADLLWVVVQKTEVTCQAALCLRERSQMRVCRITQ
jgi:hypothetical protein